MRHLEKPDLISVEFEAAIDNLSVGVQAFTGVSKKLAARMKEVEELEANACDMIRKAEQRTLELDAREKQLDERDKLISDRETYFREREAHIYSLEAQITTRMRELGELEAWWAKTEKIVEGSASKMPSKIKINVGGKEFTTSKSTLLNGKGSFFESIVVATSLQQDNSESNSKLFIDRDPKHFPKVLNFLRDGRLKKGVKQEEAEELENEFIYYGLTPPKQIITPSPSQSFIRQDSCSPRFDADTILPMAAQAIIMMWLPNQQFTMIYKASRDGFKAADFHRNCDNQGATLTIIQSKEGYLFGGYSVESWESPPNNFNKLKSNPTTFIFTLTNPHSLPPTKFSLRAGNPYSLNCSSSHCATFGGGPDIYVCSESNSSAASYTKFPTSFLDHVGKGRETFTGSLHFTTKEVEVYSIKLK